VDDKKKNRDSIPCGDKHFSPQCPDRPPFLISPYLQWIPWAVYPVVKQPGHEAGPLQSGAENDGG
jgi:hypothetical protein